MARRASSHEHEAALQYLTGLELCVDLAVNETTAIPSPRARREARQRYEEIALAIFCLRSRPLSLFQQVKRNEAEETLRNSLRDAARLDADLAAVFHDPHYSLERRREAQRQRGELAKQSERIIERQEVELVAASLSTKHHKPTSTLLIRRFNRDGREAFFGRLDAVIRRYVRAKVRDERWAASLPLLRLLALEWERDKEALWRFVEQCIGRWKETGSPMGDHRVSLVMHSVLAERADDCPTLRQREEGAQHAAKEIPAILEKIGAVVPNQSGLPARLRARSSRNIREAKAEPHIGHLSGRLLAQISKTSAKSGKHRVTKS